MAGPRSLFLKRHVSHHFFFIVVRTRTRVTIRRTVERRIIGRCQQTVACLMEFVIDSKDSAVGPYLQLAGLTQSEGFVYINEVGH